MKLYQHPSSSNARKAVMTAALLGHERELVAADLASGPQRQPEFLKLNPNGKVPVLVDGDFVLDEYLPGEAPRAGLCQSAALVLEGPGARGLASDGAAELIAISGRHLAALR